MFAQRLISSPMLHEISHQTITPFNEHDHILHTRAPAMILMQIILGANKSGAGRVRLYRFQAGSHQFSLRARLHNN